MASSRNFCGIESVNTNLRPQIHIVSHMGIGIFSVSQILCEIDFCRHRNRQTIDFFLSEFTIYLMKEKSLNFNTVLSSEAFLQSIKVIDLYEE